LPKPTVIKQAEQINMAILPLYNGAKESIPALQNHNKGLYFERFFDQYQNGWQIPEDAKLTFLKKFTGFCGNDESIDNQVIKQMLLVESLKGEAIVYQLDWHMVTGMGNPHPVENGFLWHPTLGVPYLPGSQVKGIIRSFIEQYFDGANSEKRELMYRWFGSEENIDKENNDKENIEADNQVGSLIFFDAIPVVKPDISIDIMTPHMGNWYSRGNLINNIDNDADKIPSDWHDPVPIPFLVVKEAKFLFTIAPRQGSGLLPEDMKDVFLILKQALGYLGVGAKTQTGYGYMSVDKIKTAELKKMVHNKKIEDQNKIDQEEADIKFKASMVGKNPIEQEFLTVQNEQCWLDGQGIFINNYADEWLKRLVKDPDLPTLELFKQLLNNLYKGIYENPDKTKGRKNKPVYRNKPIEVVKKLREIIENNSNE